MNVLIIGENKYNNRVSEFFSGKGCNPVIVTDVRQLRFFRGEAGSFIAKTKNAELKAELVILTEQPAAAPIEIAGLPARSLYEDEKASIKPKTDRLEPVVFLLDYACESPMAATIRALSDSAELAHNKRRVYYLAKFIRTAGRGVETLYREARDAGVTFVKYETLDITADEATEEFSIKASDGVLELAIRTRIIYADGGREVGERFVHAASKLGLTPNKDGYLLEDSYYLAPVLTSRRGVYHISRDLAAERLEEGLDHIFAYACACVGSGLWDVPPHGIAQIDGNKCILCYHCHRACPHAALEPCTLARRMQSLPKACAGCGSCASVCPGNAITLEKDIFYTGARGKADKTLVICCENSAAIAMEKTLPMLGEDAAGIETRTVPCGGRIGLEQLSDELGNYGKVIAAVCPDDACRHFSGNKRACAQTGRLSEMLERAGLSPERIRFTQVSHAMPGVFRDELSRLIRGD